MKTRPSIVPLQSGFSLIEALAALVVTAFGMLAVAGFYVSLSHSSDVAKQRSEAVRLAQFKVEELRAFEQVAGDGVGNRFDYTDDVVSGNDTVNPTAGYSNTTFTRQWQVTRDGINAASGTDLQKWIRVDVSWTDRTNTTQTVRLRTVISRSDPAAIGTIATGLGPTHTRSPKNRHIDIPYPAVDLPGGMSGFMPPSSTFNPTPKFYIFDNVYGDVLGYCNTAQSGTSPVNFDGTNCVKFSQSNAHNRYLLTGYIRFVSGNFNLNDFVNPAGPAKDLSVHVSFSDGNLTVPECFTQRQKVVSAGAIAAPRNVTGATVTTPDPMNGPWTVTIATAGNHGFSAGQYVSINGKQNVGYNGVYKLTAASGNTFSYVTSVSDPGGFNGAAAPPSTATLVQEITLPGDATAPPGYNTVKSTFVAYSCIINPRDDDSNFATPGVWSGTLYIRPEPHPITGVTWDLGTGVGQFQLCRYTGNYVNDAKISNSEHPLYYRGVKSDPSQLISGALDHQNYVVIDGNRNCPTDSAANTVISKYTNVNTTVHQTALGSANGQPSGTNPGGANGNGGFTSPESSDPSGVLPMF